MVDASFMPIKELEKPPRQTLRERIYEEVVRQISKIVSSEAYSLIETLADRIARTILEHPYVEDVWVRVAKPEAPLAVFRSRFLHLRLLRPKGPRRGTSRRSQGLVQRRRLRRARQPYH